MRINDLNTRWFDLKKYEHLKTMPIEGWMVQLLIRSQISSNLNSDSINKTKLHEAASFLKFNPVAHKTWHADFLCENIAEDIIDGPAFMTSSVNSLTSLDIWEIFNDSSMVRIFDTCNIYKDDIYGCNSDKLLKVIESPHDLNKLEQKKYSQVLKRNAHISIDLAATDEQIRKDFDHWLSQYRKTIDFQIKEKGRGKKKPFKVFTQDVFNKWIKFQLIPCIDLNLIAQIHGKKITDVKMGDLLFPDELNIEELPNKIRQTVRPMANSLLENEIYAALSIQVINDKVSKIKKTGMKNA